MADRIECKLDCFLLMIIRYEHDVSLFITISFLLTEIVAGSVGLISEFMFFIGIHPIINKMSPEM